MLTVYTSTCSLDVSTYNRLETGLRVAVVYDSGLKA